MILYDELQLIRGSPYQINDKIVVRHPTVNEITDLGQEKYNSLIHSLTATPTDLMGQLDDMGLDYEEVDDFTLFAMICKNIKVDDSKILLGSLDLSKLVPMKRQDSQEVVLVDFDKDIIIDSVVYELIVGYIRKINNLTKNVQIAGNEATKRFLIDDAKRKAKRHSPKSSITLSSIIMKLTNSRDFKYDIFNVWNLPIYVLMESLREVQKNVEYPIIKNGVYAGNVDKTKVPKKDMSWFIYD